MLGIIDGGSNLNDDALGALGILAVVFRVKLSIPRAQSPNGKGRKRRTELGKEDIERLIQGVDDFGNATVGAAGEGVGGDSGGQSHCSASEDREDSGETHFTGSEDGGLESRKVVSQQGMHGSAPGDAQHST